MHYIEQRVRVECDLTNGDVPIGQAGEPIISAASADHKKAPDGFILSPWKLIATTVLTRTTTHDNPQRKTDDLARVPRTGERKSRRAFSSCLMWRSHYL
ncbi:hypothetical protein P0D88_24880 [Paraburkholderia sp. RL18-103-BIB-C]|jgi:hypothetical protein|uniref:hypothetical protein n=1 Tax=unclassified Paraburkholderia TaxID=2615204 RepID=UPI0038B804BC